jgi:hypothetical protein
MLVKLTDSERPMSGTFFEIRSDISKVAEVAPRISGAPDARRSDARISGLRRGVYRSHACVARAHPRMA